MLLFVISNFFFELESFSFSFIFLIFFKFVIKSSEVLDTLKFKSIFPFSSLSSCGNVVTSFTNDIFDEG